MKKKIIDRKFGVSFGNLAQILGEKNRKVHSFSQGYRKNGQLLRYSVPIIKNGGWDLGVGGGGGGVKTPRPSLYFFYILRDFAR